MTKKAKKQGFTLVEIMIVVAIIGLLAAIGLPSFAKARETSRKNACINNLRIIDSAKEQYMLEIAAVPSTLATDLKDYIKGGGDKLKCPSNSAKSGDGAYTIGDASTPPVCAVTGGTHVMPN